MSGLRALAKASAGAFLLLLGVSTAALAQPTDTAVKAAFLPRFARYVTWPSAAMPKGGDPFLLCVVGADPFGTMLDDAARSQLIDGRRIIVRRMDSAASADGCQIAFVDGSKAAQALSSLASKPVLTVTDAASDGARGIIHFTLSDGRVRFFIDQALAARRGMTISSRLLALALGVRQ
ncbi:MAG TPA: YfiR family protein [Sphingomicrobium sp.]|nr:YfiR family protein [Sphingomicrobium sp.]